MPCSRSEEPNLKHLSQCRLGKPQSNPGTKPEEGRNWCFNNTRYMKPISMSLIQDEKASPHLSGAANPNYDLSKSINLDGVGLRQKLTSYGDTHFSLFMRKPFIKTMGYSENAPSRPIVGTANTYSSFNPCHANIPQLIDAVKRGAQLNGGLAIDFPSIRLHESFASPTSMYLRNLISMDTEEMIRAQPVDSVDLIGGSPVCPFSFKTLANHHYPKALLASSRL